LFHGPIQASGAVMGSGQRLRCATGSEVEVGIVTENGPPSRWLWFSRLQRRRARRFGGADPQSPRAPGEQGQRIQRVADLGTSRGGIGTLAPVIDSTIVTLRTS
jgi:hypothetical protein